MKSSSVLQESSSGLENAIKCQAREKKGASLGNYHDENISNSTNFGPRWGNPFLGRSIISHPFHFLAIACCWVSRDEVFFVRVFGCCQNFQSFFLRTQPVGMRFSDAQDGRNRKAHKGMGKNGQFLKRQQHTNTATDKKRDKKTFPFAELSFLSHQTERGIAGGIELNKGRKKEGPIEGHPEAQSRVANFVANA